MINLKFGKLLVIQEFKNEAKIKKFLCKCDCGKSCIVRKTHLISGHSTTCGCSRNTPNPNSSFYKVFNSYKHRALKKNIEFSLKEVDFKNLINNNCFYCQTPPSNLIKNNLKTTLKKEYYNGIDRIDSSKGYTIENCRPCCEQCNRMKLDYDLNFFLNHITKIYNHLYN